MAIDFQSFIVDPGPEPDDFVTAALKSGLNQFQLGQQQKRKIELQEKLVGLKDQAVQRDRALQSRGLALNDLGLLDDVDEQRKQLAILGQDAVQRGEDATIFQNLMNIEDNDELSLAITRQAQRDLITGGLNPEDLPGRGGATGTKFSAVSDFIGDDIVVQSDNQGNVTVRDISNNRVLTGDAAKEAIEAAQMGEQERRDALAQIEIDKQLKVAEGKERVKRISELKTAIGTRNREAQRTLPRLTEALTLAQQADQGFTAEARLNLARFLDLDPEQIGDIAALDASLKGLALDQLQKFKGPTTDFEFGVVQQIAGGVGNSQAANIARIKSLQRANWFQREEAKQLREFKGEPEDFAFDFQQTKQFGERQYTLEQIQSTAVANNLTIEETLRRLQELGRQ